MPEKSILDARLAEIDRRLRTIQSGLAPAAEAAEADRRSAASLVPPEAAPVPQRVSDAPGRAPGTAPVAPSPDERAGAAVTELWALVKAHERLLDSARELLERQAPGPAQPSVSLSAGPFADTEALLRFERSLQALSEVRSVTVREYEGTDRVIVDVHLNEPTT